MILERERESKEGPGRRGGMITGGQKQTSVRAANNTREQAERRAAEGGGGDDGDDGMAAGRGRVGLGWRDGWYS
jgi:hypothetical protein